MLAYKWGLIQLQIRNTLEILPLSTCSIQSLPISETCKHFNRNALHTRLFQNVFTPLASNIFCHDDLQSQRERKKSSSIYHNQYNILQFYWRLLLIRLNEIIQSVLSFFEGLVLVTLSEISPAIFPFPNFLFMAVW